MDYAWVFGLASILLTVLFVVGAAQRSKPFRGYRKVNSLCTRRELMLWRVLDSKVNNSGDYVVLTKVRLGDLINVTEGGREGFRHLMKLNRKHVDFVVADRKSLAPIIAIELDDRSHNTRRRRNRDNYVNAVFTAVKLPLLRIMFLRNIDGDHLRRIIDRVSCGNIPPSGRYPFGMIITGVES